MYHYYYNYCVKEEIWSIPFHCLNNDETEKCVQCTQSALFVLF